VPEVVKTDGVKPKVMDEATLATGTSLRDCGPEAHTTPHDVDDDTESATDTDTDTDTGPGPVADRDPAT
jgi:hypothetical protein